MTIRRITTLEEYYTQFPYDQEIINRQERERQQNTNYLEEIDPWLAENIYNKKHDKLPEGWRMVTKDEMHPAVYLNCTEKYDRKTYYVHTPTDYRTAKRPPPDMPTPIKFEDGTIYAKDLIDNSMKYYNPRTKTCTKNLPPGWIVNTDEDGYYFHHMSGLDVSFLPSADMNVQKLNNNWYYYKSPKQKKNVYYNMESSKEQSTKPDDA